MGREGVSRGLFGRRRGGAGRERGRESLLRFVTPFGFFFCFSPWARHDSHRDFWLYGAGSFFSSFF